MMLRKRSYRCGYCDLNWPLHEAYQRCPRCTTFLSPHRAPAMSVDEAIEVVAGLKRRTKLDGLFFEIIEEGGFTDKERGVIARLETQLLRLTRK